MRTHRSFGSPPGSDPMDGWPCLHILSRAGKHKKREEQVMRKENLKTGGTCYCDHLRWLMDSPKLDRAKLIHGSVWSVPGQCRIGHAWIEIADDIVIDLTIDYTGSRNKYYDHAKARVEQRYTRHDAMRKALKTGHFGPWIPKKG